MTTWLAFGIGLDVGVALTFAAFYLGDRLGRRTKPTISKEHQDATH